MRPRLSTPAVLIVLAIGVRVAAILLLRSYDVPRSTYEHGEIASNLLAGRGYSIRYLHVDGPTSMQAPVYPLAVTAAFALGGVDTPASRLLVQLAQAVLGGVLVGATIGLARSLVPGKERVAILAGLVVALHPTLVYAATHVQVALLAATLLTGALALAYRAGATGRRRDATAAGGVLAILVLTDPILGLAAPGMAWAVRAGGTARWRSLVGLMAAVSVAVVAPWVVRNGQVHGEFVPVKSTFGYAFWQGNCKESEGTDKVIRASVERILDDPAATRSLEAWNRTLWAARHEAGYIDDIALSRADYAALAPLSEPARSRWLFRRSLAELRTEPGRYTSLCLKRLQAFVFFDHTNPKTRSMLYRVPHLGLTGLAFTGLILCGRSGLRRWGPVLLASGLISAFHVLTIISARFHIPLEPLMAVGAAVAIDRGWTAVSRVMAQAGWVLQPRRLTTSSASGS
jgi:hypothetical protein